MATKTRKTKAKTSRLTQELLETARDMRASGIMPNAAYEKITMRHLGEKLTAPVAVKLSPEEIRALRVGARLSQAVFAHFLNLTWAMFLSSNAAKNGRPGQLLLCSMSSSARVSRLSCKGLVCGEAPAGRKLWTSLRIRLKFDLGKMSFGDPPKLTALPTEYEVPTSHVPKKLTGGPCGPAGPVAPAIPGAPTVPAGPVAPTGPAGPCAASTAHCAGLSDGVFPTFPPTSDTYVEPPKLTASWSP